MQADFYILKQNLNREQFACKLVEKAYALEKRVHIYASHRPQAEHMNELLWTYQDGSFIPHDMISALDSEQGFIPNVTIGYAEDQAPTKQGADDILLNLSAEIPSFSAQFPRIIEIIDDNAEVKAFGRQHFAHYRELGYQLNHYEI